MAKIAIKEIAEPLFVFIVLMFVLSVPIGILYGLVLLSNRYLGILATPWIYFGLVIAIVIWLIKTWATELYLKSKDKCK